LVEARLETGRTHQVRVHLAEHGAPLLGDPIYGRPPKSPALRMLARQLGRQALHAAVLGIEHPVTHERLRWETPLPADLAAALETARDFDKPPA
jgi:23S rRNA pseudouridine1911/1915/1917 synthase